MTLVDVAQHKGVRWGALVALLVGVSQFNTGLELFYSKWSADKKAEAATKTAEVAVDKAEEAQETAEQVDEDFRDYLEAQQKVADALNRYVAQQTQQRPVPHSTRLWDADAQRWYCDDGVETWWEPQEGCS